MSRVTFHNGPAFKRFAVNIKCTSHPEITDTVTFVFAGNEREARAAAIDKMQDKWLFKHNRHTVWIVTDEPEEA